MDFLPVSLDDSQLDGRQPSEVVMRAPPPGITTSSKPTNLIANPNANAGEDVLTALHPETSLPKAVHLCLQSFYHEANWEVPFPEHPAAPLLYLPERYQQLRWSPDCFGIMNSEVDGLANGVLDSIPLGYFPLKASDVQQGLDAARTTLQHIQKMQEKAIGSGKMEQTTWKPEEVNPNLDAEDVELLDTDIDKRLEQQREIPSIAVLLQRPTYTEMGSNSSPQQRHASRLSRVLPEGFGGAAAEPHSSAALLASAASLRLGSVGEDAAADHRHAAPTLHAEKQKGWPTEVKRSFRLARSIDVEYQAFLEGLTEQKLGLDKSNPRHVEVTLRLWQAIGALPHARLQQGVWGRLCTLSNTYHPDHSSVERAVREVVAQLAAVTQLSYFNMVWPPLLQEYVEAVDKMLNDAAAEEKKKGVSGKDMEALLLERKQKLKFGSAELDVKASADFLSLDHKMGPLLSRQSQKSHASRNQEVNIYPVAVTPVFPSGYTHAAELLKQHHSSPGHRSASPGSDGEVEPDTEFLAEAAQGVGHVSLPSAVIPEGRSAQQAPHMMVNGCLLYADGECIKDWAKLPTTTPTEASPLHPDRTSNHKNNITKNNRSSGVNIVSSGSTMLYYPRCENTFEPLYSDDANTSSYLFHHFELPLHRRVATLSAQVRSRPPLSGGGAIRHHPKTNAVVSSAPPSTQELLEAGAEHPVLGDVLQQQAQEHAASAKLPRLQLRTALEQPGSPGLPSATPLEVHLSAKALAALRTEVRAASARGAVGVDGAVMVYNRVGLRDYFRKAAKGVELPVDAYAVVFSDEGEEEVQAEQSTQKRPRGAAAQDEQGPPSTRVKLEA